MENESVSHQKKQSFYKIILFCYSVCSKLYLNFNSYNKLFISDRQIFKTE